MHLVLFMLLLRYQQNIQIMICRRDDYDIRGWESWQ